MAEKKSKDQKNIRLLISNRRFLIIAVTLCVANLLLGFMVIFPQVQAIQQKRTLLEREQARLLKLERKVQILTSVTSSDFYSEKDRIDYILPSYKPLLPLIQRFENISGESNVIVSGFTVNPGSLSTESAQVSSRSRRTKSDLPSNVEGIDLELNVIGDIQNVNRFLAAIDSLAPITEIKTITLSTSNRRSVLAEAQAEDIDIYDAKLALSSFYFVGQPSVEVDRDLPEFSRFGSDLLTEIQNFRILSQTVVPSEFQVEGGGKENLFQ